MTTAYEALSPATVALACSASARAHSILGAMLATNPLSAFERYWERQSESDDLAWIESQLPAPDRSGARMGRCDYCGSLGSVEETYDDPDGQMRTVMLCAPCRRLIQ